MTSDLKLEQIPFDGIEIGSGAIKTADGTIRIPKSKMKKESKEDARKDNNSVQEQKPPAKISKMPDRRRAEEAVTFNTDIGTASGYYYPVIDCGDHIALGLTENSFVPKSFKEAPKLRLDLDSKSVKARVVYTGCRFTDPDVDREYIILMKVKDNA